MLYVRSIITGMKKSSDDIFRERQAVEGKKGGDTTLRKYGSSFFSKIATDSWEKRRKQKDEK